jgi:heme exporter protein D
VETLSSYFAMGGYAAFVWPSYALALAGLVGILAISRRSVTALQNDLNRLRPRREGTTSEVEGSGAQSGDEHP